jgi:hypothetical protein
MTPRQTHEFLRIPERRSVEVFIEEGWVKIAQHSSEDGVQEIRLTATDAYRITRSLKDAAKHVRSQGYL